jgi:hypothetical protein
LKPNTNLAPVRDTLKRERIKKMKTIISTLALVLMATAGSMSHALTPTGFPPPYLPPHQPGPHDEAKEIIVSQVSASCSSETHKIPGMGISFRYIDPDRSITWYSAQSVGYRAHRLYYVNPDGTIAPGSEDTCYKPISGIEGPYRSWDECEQNRIQVMQMIPMNGPRLQAGHLCR